jgi:hypothetical protein
MSGILADAAFVDGVGTNAAITMLSAATRVLSPNRGNLI